jgi:hypothetical protein
MINWRQDLEREPVRPIRGGVGRTRLPKQPVRVNENQRAVVDVGVEIWAIGKPYWVGGQKPSSLTGVIPPAKEDESSFWI